MEMCLCREIFRCTHVCTALADLDNNYASIFCNQENFVLKGNSHKILQSLPRHHVFIKPAKKEKLSLSQKKLRQNVKIYHQIMTEFKE